MSKVRSRVEACLPSPTQRIAAASPDWTTPFQWTCADQPGFFACPASHRPSGPSVWPTHAAYAPVKRNINKLRLADDACLNRLAHHLFIWTLLACSSSRLSQDLIGPWLPRAGFLAVRTPQRAVRDSSEGPKAASADDPVRLAVVGRQPQLGERENESETD